MIEPNKYAKNANIKPDTPLKTIISIISMILMFIGIGGITSEFFKDNSWVTKTLAWFFEKGTHMALIPVVVASLWFLDRWFSSPGKGETRKSGDIPMYIMMVIGASYAYHFFKTGSI